MEAPEVILYSDGACSGNPGPGGWAALLKSPSTGRAVELSGGDPATTNNRMEMTAVLEGLRHIKKAPSRVHVVSDSNYVIKGLTEWLPGWERNGWRTADKKPVKNRELWIELVTEVRKHRCTFEWVRGHQGHAENERVDALAVAAYQKYLG